MIFKRGNIYWYKFDFRGEEHRGTTFQTNAREARQVEAKVRSDLTMGLFGIAVPKVPPTLEVFIRDSFLPYIETHCLGKPRTVQFYKEKCRRLLEFKPLATARLTAIDEDMRVKYVSHRLTSDKRSQGKGKVSFVAVNRELAGLRRALLYAKALKLIPDAPKIAQIPGEKDRGRSFILTGELETAYFEVAEYPLKHAAILLADFGLRPDECVRILKTDCFDTHLQIRSGKTEAAARTMPMTPRAWAMIEELWALWPESPWLFPGQRTGRHLTVWGLDMLHSRLRKAHNWPKEFVLYSFRHTFGTRLAESGSSPYDIKQLMGHSDMRISQKYIHPTPSHLVLAMKRKEAYDKMLRGECQNFGEQKVGTISDDDVQPEKPSS